MRQNGEFRRARRIQGAYVAQFDVRTRGPEPVSQYAFHVRNADLFEQAIDEAVENAVKHGDQSPPEVAITADRSSDPEYVYISVADNGPGIPELERRVIDTDGQTNIHTTYEDHAVRRGDRRITRASVSFDFVHQYESGEETPLQHCLGIGFWMMKWVVTTLGGGLTISDNDPRGSVVTFQLPSVDRSVVVNSSP
jgi:signal transduction histidine kinase